MHHKKHKHTGKIKKHGMKDGGHDKAAHSSHHEMNKKHGMPGGFNGGEHDKAAHAEHPLKDGNCKMC